ncbi:glycosyltransferase family 39 protein [Patescibacteria group bacterium]|nr:glycosyltransferase family 39 protein [Patescibacteria group bacterium]
MKAKEFLNLKKILKNPREYLKNINLPILLLILMIPLRFINLGYSEYICDESVALTYLKDTGTFYSTEFLISQHKGPIQYLIGGIIFLFSKTFFNELIYRIPFAIANILSIVVFYLFVKNVTKSKLAAFTSSFLLGVNSMIVVFGRIFQYQSFNLLFSFLTLYFYSKITTSEGSDSGKNLIKSSVIGTLFFCLSLLSHWDAVFILPYVFYVIFSVITLNKKYSKKFKSIFVLTNVSVVLLLAVFYLIPYVSHFINSAENQAYFRNRVSPGSISFEKFIDRAKFLAFRLKLYNPFFYVELFLGFFVASLFYFKKYWLYILWFIAEFLIFTLIFTNPGTHIYNLFIPLSVLSGFLIQKLHDYTSQGKKIRNLDIGKVFSISYVLISLFFYYQTYTLFVNHKPEYPWRTKRILFLKAGDFNEKERSDYMRKNKIGFPLRREWKKIEEIMEKYERENNIQVGSTKLQTNENSCPALFYTDRKLSDYDNRFIVAIKYPLSLVNDYKNFSREKNKELIGTIKNDNGDSIAFIYITK